MKNTHLHLKPYQAFNSHFVRKKHSLNHKSIEQQTIFQNQKFVFQEPRGPVTIYNGFSGCKRQYMMGIGAARNAQKSLLLKSFTVPSAVCQHCMTVTSKGLCSNDGNNPAPHGLHRFGSGQERDQLQSLGYFVTVGTIIQLDSISNIN